MRKEVKPAITCKCCGQVTEYPVTQQFCDQCGKQFPENMYPLTLDISMNMDEHSQNVELCSWKCVRDFIIANKKNIDTAWYVALPMPIFKDNRKSKNKQYCDSGANFYKDFLQINSSKQTEASK